MCGMIDRCCQFTPYNIIRSLLIIPKNHLSWMRQKNPAGSCLDVRFLYEDYLLYSHVGVEDGVEFMP